VRNTIKPIRNYCREWTLRCSISNIKRFAHHCRKPADRVTWAWMDMSEWVEFNAQHEKEHMRPLPERFADSADPSPPRWSSLSQFLQCANTTRCRIWLKADWTVCWSGNDSEVEDVEQGFVGDTVDGRTSRLCRFSTGWCCCVSSALCFQLSSPSTALNR